MIELDLNQETFQADFLRLQKIEALAFIKTLRKLKSISWAELHQDRGLRWESTKSLRKNTYTIRITLKCRAVVERDGNTLRFLSLHPDHDSAYR